MSNGSENVTVADNFFNIKNQFPIFLPGPTGTVIGPTGTSGRNIYDIVANIGPTGTSPMTTMAPNQIKSLKEIGPIQTDKGVFMLIGNATLNTSNSQYLMTIGRSIESGGNPSVATNIVDGQLNINDMLSNNNYLAANYNTTLTGTNSITLSGQCTDSIVESGSYYYNLYVAYFGTSTDVFLADATAVLTVINITNITN